ncbi:antibiotic ABC transporter permease [Halocatena pleomorpha]|uniref:Antibiotic ABC transporter permease n=1 Tax=Halocatena pleomorpha TaxID=1785090 RepID=A0A3P3RJY2_9EURY|nr:antibiotic ABC transporter permease [Halocatena pleomorpha]
MSTQTAETSATNDEQHLIEVLRETLTYAREREYRGWDYGDGMSSRLLRMLPVDNRWLNIFVQELAKRPPINVRPLLLVEQRRNYKGTSLFAMANLNTARLLGEIEWNSTDRIDMESVVKNGEAADTTEQVDYKREAYQLNEWLIANRSVGYSGFCGGHNHKIQHIDGKGLPNDPDIVSTSYAVKSLLSARGLDPMYPSIAQTAEQFIVEDLDYRTVNDGAVINYHLNHSSDIYTINAGAIGARMLIDLYAYFEKESYRRRAQQIFDHIVGLQTDLGGWMYRDPSSSSHLSMDNHHNGFVIESLLRYRAVTGSDRYEETIDRALSFYRETLFDPSGAPNWDENKTYPRDIHASAQGILVFTYAGDLDFARRILAWTLDQLYAGNGRFYYRKHRLYTTRITLMRWCQAWMAYAISEYLTALHEPRSSVPTSR